MQPVTDTPISSTRPKKTCQALLVCLLTLTASVVSGTPSGARRDKPAIAAARQLSSSQAEAPVLYNCPLSFEPNVGQAGKELKFLSHGPEFDVYLTVDKATLLIHPRRPQSQRTAAASRRHGSSDPHLLQLKLLHANGHAAMAGTGELATHSNYFLGSDPKDWHRNIPNYAQVRYQDVYPGIDLVYRGNQGHLEYDFLLRPGANPAAIRIAITGGRRLHIDKAGDLVAQVGRDELRWRIPQVYQDIAGRRSRVTGRYFISNGNEIGFRLGEYDASHSVIIDPELVYSSFLGGQGSDSAAAIAVDKAGNAYITGATGSADFPVTTGSFDTTFAGTGSGSMAFVTKFNADGAMVYSTFLGGNPASDSGTAIAVDESGNAYITGITFSSNFPTTEGAFQRTRKGSSNSTAFVTKLAPNGASLIYSTLIGGSGPAAGFGIAVDSSSNAFIVGTTAPASPPNDFPTTAGAFQQSARGGADVFVSKFNATGSALVYSTFLGGSGGDNASAIALDSAGNAYVTGDSQSNDFPTTPGAFQTSRSSLSRLAFVTKLNASGSALMYSTYLGGSTSIPRSIAADNSGIAYVAGIGSPDFPTTEGAFQRSSTVQPAFVSKLSVDGSRLIASTLLGGGNGSNAGLGVVIDSSGNVFITGATSSTTFPVQNPMQAALGGDGRPCDPRGGDPCPDAFLTELNPSLSALLFSTYLGGSNNDTPSQTGTSIAIDSFGNVLLAGGTNSADFPTRNARQGSLKGTLNAFVVKISFATNGGGKPPDFSVSASPQSSTIKRGSTATFTINLTPENGFDSSVSLSCLGLPAQTSCSFSPASVTPNGASASSTLTISTAASSAMLRRPPSFYAMLLPACGFALIGLCLLPPRMRVSKSITLATVVLLFLALSLAGCGGVGSTPPGNPPPTGGSGGTPTGSFAITVMANSGSTQHSTVLQLAVL